MPFNIVKSGRGWKVQDDKGNYYSKKPLTKTMARRQQKALYASESRREHLSGSGYASYTDDEGNHHILLQGEGWFSDIWTKVKQVGNKVVSALVPKAVQGLSDVASTGIRLDYPPAARETLARFGAGQVFDLLIVREPIQSFINTALNAITLGKWNEARKELNYDRLFHLSMVASVAMPNGDKQRIKIEKNEVINITDKFELKVPGVSSGVSQHGSGRDAEVMNVPVSCCITLQQMMDKAAQAKGPDFFKYDAFTNNCQMFLLTILRANDLLTPQVEGFISQDTTALLQRLPSYTAPFASLVTNIAGLANRFMYGRGDLEGGCDDCGGTCMEAKGNRRVRGGVSVRRVVLNAKEHRGLYVKQEDGTWEWQGGLDAWKEAGRPLPPNATPEQRRNQVLSDTAYRQADAWVKAHPKEVAERKAKEKAFRGGADGLQKDGSWVGDFDAWGKAGNPGCGPNYKYNLNGDCYENCQERDMPFSCVFQDEADRQRGDLEKYKDKAQIRTALQDENTLSRFFAIDQFKQDENDAKGLTSDSGIPPVPKWEDIPEYTADMVSTPEKPSSYTGFAKQGDINNQNQGILGFTYDIYYIKNGTIIRTGLKPGTSIKYNFDWKKAGERWDRLQAYDPTRPANFATSRKDGSLIQFDERGREKFDISRHGSVDWLNSVEGRHVREADPYFEELYKRVVESEHSFNNRSEEAARKREQELEDQYQKSLRDRYGENQDIYSPEANFTLTNKKGNKVRVNKVRLRKDGGYDIQFGNGTWEYQAGEDEWDCNDWKRGDRIEDYGVCGTQGRIKAGIQKAQNINRERDQQWDNMSGWDKFKNGLGVFGAVTQDYILPIASSVLQFVPGVGQAISTGLDVAKMATDAVVGDECRHFNECTDRMIDRGKNESVYHQTKGDTIAGNYLQDENWQKLLEPNEKVYGLIRDTAKYGSRAGKLAETGAGRYTGEGFNQKMFDELQASIPSKEKWLASFKRRKATPTQTYEEWRANVEEINKKRAFVDEEAQARTERMIEEARQHNEEYARMVAENPDLENVWCNANEEGEPKKTMATRGQCRLNNSLRFKKWEEKEHPANAFFFRPAVDAIAKTTGFLANVVPGIPQPLREVGKWAADQAVAANSIDGSGIGSMFRRQLKAEGLTPEKYLEIVRDIANEEGYDGRAIEFSDDPDKKLMIYDDEGKKHYFGAVGYNDYIIWSKKEALGKVKKGYAEMKRRVFNKSHSKMPGDWKGDKYSPNNLAMKILW